MHRDRLHESSLMQVSACLNAAGVTGLGVRVYHKQTFRGRERGLQIGRV